MFQEARKMSHSLRQLWNWYTHNLYTQIQIFLMGENRGFLFQTGVRHDSVSYTPHSACATNEILGAENIFITHVDWRKRSVSPYHEYLVVYVQEERSDGAKPRKSVVMIEREVSNLVAEEDSKEPQTKAPTLIFTRDGREMSPPTRRLLEILNHKSHKSLSKKKTFSAADHLTFSLDGTDSLIKGQWPSDVCRRLTINGAHVSVTQLAVLTRVVHDHCRSYRLLDYQCYWFAEVIYITIKELVECSIKSSSSGSCRDDCGPSPLNHGYFELGGVSFEVTRGGEDTPRLISEEYQAAWSEYQEEITRAEDSRRREREPEINALEERIETVQAKADEAQAQADQERLEKEQAQAQAGQAQAQADQAQAQADQERLEKERAQAKMEELMARLAKYEAVSLGDPAVNASSV